MPQTNRIHKPQASGPQLFHRLRAIESGLSPARLMGMRPRAQAELLRSVSRQYAMLAAEIEAVS